MCNCYVYSIVVVTSHDSPFSVQYVTHFPILKWGSALPQYMKWGSARYILTYFYRVIQNNTISVSKDTVQYSRCKKDSTMVVALVLPVYGNCFSKKLRYGAVV